MDLSKIKQGDTTQEPNSPDNADNNAETEQAIVSQKNYDEEREEEYNATTHRIQIFALWVAALIVIAGFSAITITWLIHLIYPSAGWLDPNQLTQIKSILLGLIIGGSGSTITKTLFKDRFSKT